MKKSSNHIITASSSLPVSQSPNHQVTKSPSLPPSLSPIRIAIIGLGYVGLPLARLFATKYPVVGFDINQGRVNELMSGHDSTLEVEDDILQSVLLTSNPIKQTSDDRQQTPTIHNEGEATVSPSHQVSPSPPLPLSQSPNHPDIGLFCTTDIQDIVDANFYVVTVPTPVDRNNNPDLTPLYKASETVGKVISKGDIVVYESTVYPGVTEDECIPVVERVSGLKFNEDFFAGYSPERINPGDKERTVEKITKVTSGSTPEIGEKVNTIYASVINAGTHLAPSIKVAEAAKVIENAQRDINIAFVNELAKIFNKMGIDTQDVLKAARTKWNFLPFTPGLVGGHCIGVDPYYLAQAAQRAGYNPEIILSGRRMNDSMGEYVAEQVVKLMLKKGIQVLDSHVLILGFTFKENCPDVRNTKVIDIVKTLQEYNVEVTIHDPWANPEIARYEYGVEITNSLPNEKFDAVVLAVAHKEFQKIDISSITNEKSVVYDVKGLLKDEVGGRL